MQLDIGLNGRFFPKDWRPASEEIEFCQQNGFAALQFRAPEGGLTHKHLGAEFAEVTAVLERTGITAVMEINIAVGSNGMTFTERTPLDVLYANLPAIQALNCTAVHWHLVPNWPLSDHKCRSVEQALIPQLAEATRLGDEYGFRFGLEHNEPKLRLCATPAACQHLINSVPKLGFVWDFNHTAPDDFAGYAALAPHLSLLHISDTHLPAINQHLPLGEGTLDFRPFLQAVADANFNGIGILEIGGLPASGGYGRDSDQTLSHSRDLLQTWLSEL